jgi:peptidoglycan/xylan/chitin deacetylase (PgdA/CDA1 family)
LKDGEAKNCDHNYENFGQFSLHHPHPSNKCKDPIVFPTASDMIDASDAAVTSAEEEDDEGGGDEGGASRSSGVVFMVDPGGGGVVRRRRESALRVAGAAAASLVGVVPWAVAVGVESLVRKGSGGNDQFGVRGAGWDFVSSVYSDVTTLSSLSSAYANMRWAFPQDLSKAIAPASNSSSSSSSSTLRRALVRRRNGKGKEATGNQGGGGGDKGGADEDEEGGVKDGEKIVEGEVKVGQEEQEEDGQQEEECGLVALTIDDAPGDNPEAFAALLDVLKEFGARATFFCTTNTLEACGGLMKPLVARALKEGHELCNHCPADRPYHLDRMEGFKAELLKAEDAIEPFVQEQARMQQKRDEFDDKRQRKKKRRQMLESQMVQKDNNSSNDDNSKPLETSWVNLNEDKEGQGGGGGGEVLEKEGTGEGGGGGGGGSKDGSGGNDGGGQGGNDDDDADDADGDDDDADVPFLSTTRKRWKWFRPPSGMMSSAMATVLRDHGYSPVLGDVFSNDVFVGGDSLSNGRAAGPKTVEYHVGFCVKRTKPGSVVIFHVPQAKSRLMSADLVRGYLTALRGAAAHQRDDQDNNGSRGNGDNNGSNTSTSTSSPSPPAATTTATESAAASAEENGQEGSSGGGDGDGGVKRRWSIRGSFGGLGGLRGGGASEGPGDLPAPQSTTTTTAQAVMKKEPAAPRLRCVTLSELANAVNHHSEEQATRTALS